MAECAIGPITINTVVHIHVPFGSNELFNISSHVSVHDTVVERF